MPADWVISRSGPLLPCRCCSSACPRIAASHVPIYTVRSVPIGSCYRPRDVFCGNRQRFRWIQLNSTVSYVSSADVTHSCTFVFLFSTDRITAQQKPESSIGIKTRNINTIEIAKQLYKTDKSVQTFPSIYALEYFDSIIEQFQIRVDVTVPHGHDFIVNERSKHLALKETAEEWPMMLLLIG